MDGREIPQPPGWSNAFDYEHLNSLHTTSSSRMDDPRHGNIRLGAIRFTRSSTGKYPYAKTLATFEGMLLPHRATMVRATAFDVRGNHVSVDWPTPWTTVRVVRRSVYLLSKYY